MKRFPRCLVLVAAACLGGLATAGDADYSKMIDKGQREVEAFFGSRFPEPIHLTIAPSRADFDKAFPASWGMGKTECWMVGVGVADFMVLLSPAAWKKEACEHNPDDATEVQRLVTHELVHVFHGQHNPTRDFTGAEEIGWFNEGLAVLASGQLDAERLSRTVDAVRSGDEPKTLGEMWTGKNKYGRAGSMVRYLDEKYGRKTLIALLPVVKQADLLARLGVTEDQLLRNWKAWLLKDRVSK